MKQQSFFLLLGNIYSYENHIFVSCNLPTELFYLSIDGTTTLSKNFTNKLGI